MDTLEGSKEQIFNEFMISIKCRHFRQNNFSVNFKSFYLFYKTILHIPSNCFSHFTLLKWNVKDCFVKLIKTLRVYDY